MDYDELVLRLLFIDDDAAAQRTLSMILADDYTVISAFTAAEGLKLVQQEAPDVILLDINLPDTDGIQLLETLTAIPTAPAVVMLTAYSDVKFVVSAMQAGAYDYIVKPYTTTQLKGTIRRAVQNLPKRRAFARESTCPALDSIIGESAPIRNLKQIILRYATTDSAVLIRGESGSGKELVAQAIHQLSPRAAHRLVAVNCGALPESLLETELFGSERGAFTDAITRPGSFERADAGTVFLDEIGEIPPQAQVKFLRILEQKEVTRVGGTHVIPVNVRVVSATNVDCREQIKQGRLREDLYYRISVLPIDVPPLRERVEDILLLAAHFTQELSDKTHRLDSAARDKLLSHSWPGNVRELRNAIERAVLLSEEPCIRARDVILT